MSTSNHIIESIVFDIDFNNQGKVNDLQNRVSRLFNSGVSDEIAPLFDKIFPSHVLVTFDTVEVTLPSIPIEYLERDLADAVLNGIKDALGERLNKLFGSEHDLSRIDHYTSAGGDVSINSIHGVNLKLLEEYLLLGILPWNATKNISGPDDLFLSIHDTAKDSLKDLISGLGPNLTVRKRLAYQLSEETIHKVIELVEPSNANFIINYHSEVIRVQEEKHNVQAGLSDFKKSVWLFILTYLFVDRGSYYNQKDFIKSTLTQLANQYNLSYSELLSFFSDALSFNKWKILNTTELVFIINELGNEEKGILVPRLTETREQQMDAIAERIDRSLSVLEKLNVVKYFLAFGSLPQSMPEFSKAEIELIMGYLLDNAAVLFREMLTAEGRNESVRYRLAHAFDDAIAIRVLALLEPTHNEAVSEYAEKIQQAVRRSSIISFDDNRFNKSFRKYILDFLLVERGSTFEDKSFLKYGLTGIARHYNIAFSTMLNVFADNLKELNVLGERDMYLFSLLHEIEKENMADRAIDQDYLLPSDDNAKEQSIFEENTLKHWLRNGTAAWWNEPGVQGTNTGIPSDEKKPNDDLYAVPYMPPLTKLKYWISKGIFLVVSPEEMQFSPEDMLASLVAGAPDSALDLLKYAGKQEYSRKRFTAQISTDLKLDIIGMLPFGRSLQSLFREIMSTIETRFELTATDRSLLGNEAFSLLWAEMINGRYRDFNTERYVSALLREIPVLLRISSSVLIKKFIDNGIIQKPVLLPKAVKKRWANRAPHAKEENEEALTLAFDIVNDYLGRSATNDTDKRFFEERLDEYKRRPDLMLTLKSWVFFSKIIKHFNAADGPSPAKVLTAVADIFSYYLGNNSLPGELEILSPSEQALFLRQLILLLYKENRIMLILMLSRDAHIPEVRIRLRELFLYPTDTVEASIRDILLKNFGQDINSSVDDLINSMQQTDRTGGKPANDNISATGDKEHALLTLVNNIQKQNDSALVKQALDEVTVSNTAISQLSGEADPIDVYSMLQRSGLLWSTGAISFIKETELMLISSLSDVFIIKTVKALFREFNLLYLSGRYSINSTSAYIFSLFGFLSAKRNIIGYAAFSFLVSGALRYLEEYPAFTSSLLRKIDSETPHTSSFTDVGAIDHADKFIPATEEEQRLYEEELAQFHKEFMRVADTIVVGEKKDQSNDIDKRGTSTNPALPVNDPLLQVSSSLTDIDTNIENIEGKIYVENAGLTMLHPFLATYFDRLGMLANGNFKDQDTRIRAAYLLQYLVFGTTDFPEHTMVLNKVLVDLPIAIPFPGSIEITQKEKEISAQLLNAVIQNWDKLKNTSAESFQASFLQRAGILTFMDEAWTLKVEQRGYDIILQTLPWGLSMIKCPWMRKFLYIQWI